jgi:hypothetical protein
MLLNIKRINVPPGQRVLLSDVTWQEFETILDAFRNWVREQIQ